jgi:AraC-like DNA-binding protein
MGGAASRAARPTEVVRAWRPDGLPRVIAMDGVVSSHAAEPRGEYMIGVIGRRPMRLQRGGTGHVLGPGSLAVLDPLLPHRGAPAADGPWRCRLLIMELPDVTALVGDPDLGRQTPPVFAEPVLRDPGLAGRFVALHRLLAGPASLLERQGALASWWGEAVRWAAGPERRAAARGTDAAAVRRALSLVADSPAADVSLADLAAEAGLSQYRLIEAFRQRFGTTPHAFQVAQRVNQARRLLEAGVPAAEAAARAGFYDQSHLHRHFRRRLGLTPAAYAAAFGHRHHDFVQEPAGAPALVSGP